MTRRKPRTANPTALERAGELAARASSLRPEDPRLRHGLYVTVSAIVVGSATLAITSTVHKLPHLRWRLSVSWLLLAIATFAAVQLVNAELWRRLLASLGHRMPARRSTAIWCTSVLGRYVPSSIAMPMVRVAMAERAGAPKRVCLASIVYEQALALTAALLVGSYFVVHVSALRGTPFRFAVLLLPVAALALLHPRVFHRTANFLLVRLGRATLPRVLPARLVLSYLTGYCLTFVLAGLGLYALMESLYPVSPDALAVAIGAFGFATTVAVLAFVLPGGLAAREAGLAVALAPAIPTGPAIAAAILVRIIQLGLELVLATVTPILGRTTQALPSPAPGSSGNST
jgi:hypothetical protein